MTTQEKSEGGYDGLVPATAHQKKRHSPMAYNKPLVRRRIFSTANRFKHSRIEEIEGALSQLLVAMYAEGLLPFKHSDLRDMVFVVKFEANGMTVYLPERLKRWLEEGS